ncbi:ATP-grasp domain-containing protein, partial [Streptomyces alkaliphilus]|nr:ATP-grasp domain-containing protein [Streptomyces alkaliphilus]
MTRTADRKEAALSSGTPIAILLDPAPAAVRAARKVGARCLALASPSASPEVRQACLMADERVDVDWSDHPSLLEAIHHFADPPTRSSDRRPRASVLGFTAVGSLAAARANESLGLPGNPHAAVAYLTDKAALRDRVNRSTASPVRFERCDRVAALVPTAERVGFPCVVKPRTGSGGTDVHLLRSAADADVFSRRSAPEPALIVEEYLEGPELRVDVHSRDGRHTVLAVSRRVRPAQSPSPASPGPGTFVLTGSARGWDLPVDLGRREQARVQRLAETTLTAAGHRHGHARVEMVLTRRGPLLLEADADPGADPFPEFLAAATGHDIHALTLAGVLGRPDPGVRRSPAGYAGLRRILSADGLPPAPERVEAARAVPGVVSVDVRRRTPAPVGTDAPSVPRLSRRLPEPPGESVVLTGRIGGITGSPHITPRRPAGFPFGDTRTGPAGDTTGSQALRGRRAPAITSRVAGHDAQVAVIASGPTPGRVATALRAAEARLAPPGRLPASPHREAARAIVEAARAAYGARVGEVVAEGSRRVGAEADPRRTDRSVGISAGEPSGSRAGGDTDRGEETPLSP